MTPTANTPLTRAEIQHYEAMALAAESGGPADIILGELSRDLLPRAISDLRRLRELLERAPVPCLHADDGQGFIQSCELDPKPCDGCTWNAERKRALEGWGK